MSLIWHLHSRFKETLAQCLEFNEKVPWNEFQTLCLNFTQKSLLISKKNSFKMVIQGTIHVCRPNVVIFGIMIASLIRRLTLVTFKARPRLVLDAKMIVLRAPK